MEFIKIERTDSPLFPALRDIYEASFPLSEQRSLRLQELALKDPGYELLAVVEEGRVLGLIGSWNLSEFVYLEHLAFSPECRGKGLGSRALSSYIAGKTLPVILEIDPLIDDISRRRLGFYQRLGFVLTPHIHIQPPFHSRFAPLSLLILSQGRAIDREEYDRFNKEYLERVMNFRPE